MSSGEVQTQVIQHGQFCTECGYDLRALTSDRCPECGTPLDRGTISETRLPWMRRDQRSIVGAYLATVWLAFIKPRKLAEEIRRPVSYDSARSFQIITVLLALAPITAYLIDAYFRNTSPNPYWASYYDSTLIARFLPPTFGTPTFLPDWLLLASIHVGMFLFLLFATGLPSYAFHPAEIPPVHQNRAVTLSYYACAPLAFTPITIGLIWLSDIVGRQNFVWRRMNVLWFYPLVAVALVAPLVQVFHWWISTVVLHHRTTLCSMFRSAVIAILLPIGWTALAIGFLLLFPASIYALLIYLFGPASG